MNGLTRAASCLLLLFGAGCQNSPGELTGSMEAGHVLTLSISGPESSETADPNPFLDYRMTVHFDHVESGTRLTVPGYFAADGNSADSGATRGNIWKAHLLPEKSGLWSYRVTMRQGPGLAIQKEGPLGSAVEGDGAEGEFVVTPARERENDARYRGKLRYTGERYLRFGLSQEYFLKGGTDSPENFLAYAEFDWTAPPRREPGTSEEGEARTAPRHHYEPHITDWRTGDPTWGEGRGKGIIGALNYLSSNGMNSVYFLPMNLEGDGEDVWPYLDPESRYRFDCSRLEQWNRVVDHMDRLGQMLHVVLTETENESLFEAEEGGLFADSRKIYYRELVARFSHHNMLVWNLGEENGWSDRGFEAEPQKRGNTDEQRRLFADYIRELDPYDNPIVVHTLPGRYDEIYEPLLGYQSLEGPSLQISDVREVHAETLKWIRRSKEAGRPWFVCLDEIGPAHTGVKPDAEDPEHNEVRRYGLWGNLMAGGAGVEWYFGYDYPQNDLNLEDFRSREKMWEQTRIALDFFHDYLPFPEMQPADDLTADEQSYCLALPPDLYAVYRPGEVDLRIRLSEGSYSVDWFDPRSGGRLRTGSRESVEGGDFQQIGDPPADPQRDWVALVRLLREAPESTSGPAGARE